MAFGLIQYAVKKDNLAFTLYRVPFQLDSSGKTLSQLLDTIRTTLRTLGMDDVWDHQFNYTKMSNLKFMVEKGLKDVHIRALIIVCINLSINMKCIFLTYP